MQIYEQIYRKDYNTNAILEGVLWAAVMGYAVENVFIQRVSKLV